VNNYFILSLSVADCCVGLIVLPLSGMFVLNDSQWILPGMVCQVWLSVDYVMCTASILNLTVLSVDRYLSIRSPLAYLKERTKRRAYIVITCVWLVSLTWIFPIYGYHHVFRGGEKLITGERECETEFHLNTTFKFITSLFNFWFPLSVIIFTYIKIFGQIRENSKMDIGQKTTLSALVKQTTVVSAALSNNLKQMADEEYMRNEESELKQNLRNQRKDSNPNRPGSPQKLQNQQQQSQNLAHKYQQRNNQQNPTRQNCSQYATTTAPDGTMELKPKPAAYGHRGSSPRNSNVSMISEKSKSIRNTSASILSYGAKSKFIISHSSEIKAAKQLGILAACFIICWLPYFILFQVVTLCTECVNNQLITASIWLGYLNRYSMA
ncbi:histamine H1 receptor-like, partial [Convolutriloba macropyga]|uniref:histamine H1 receptor-like n=1 Tax=Convolutriloba macropyga TaxID=536237 RepID=UPI003F51B1D3